MLADNPTVLHSQNVLSVALNLMSTYNVKNMHWLSTYSIRITSKLNGENCDYSLPLHTVLYMEQGNACDHLSRRFEFAILKVTNFMFAK